eukprot:6176553-Pleurochrysis_carterae.AAC.3
MEILDDWMTPWLELVERRGAHAGASRLWKKIVAPQSVPGFSNVRWHSKAEIIFVIAENFGQLGHFLDVLDERECGEATRKKLRAIYDNAAKQQQLMCACAAMLDMRVLVKITYELEGDRLEILLVHGRIEYLRHLGCSLRANADGVLPNLDAILRSSTKIVRGTMLKK